MRRVLVESTGIGKAPFFAGVYTGIASLVASYLLHVGLIDLDGSGVENLGLALLIFWPFLIFVIWPGIKVPTKVTAAQERVYGNLFFPTWFVPTVIRFWRFTGGLLLTFVPGGIVISLLTPA